MDENEHTKHIEFIRKRLSNYVHEEGDPEWIELRTWARQEKEKA